MRFDGARLLSSRRCRRRSPRTRSTTAASPRRGTQRRRRRGAAARGQSTPRQPRHRRRRRRPSTATATFETLHAEVEAALDDAAETDDPDELFWREAEREGLLDDDLLAPEPNDDEEAAA